MSDRWRLAPSLSPDRGGVHDGGMSVLRGEVTTGVGDLAKWMRMHAERYEAATGMRLYPGSLNVRLPQAWPLPDHTMMLPAEHVGRLVHLVPCSVYGRACFIFRTDNAEQVGPDEQRFLEILAEVRLRDEFGLTDGDVVEIVVEGQ
jgi:riboflavin kinase, archaea type